MSGGARAVTPRRRPLDATVAVPGSKSITNRALLCAALADGESVIDGALRADDTEAMAGCVTQFGAEVEWSGERIVVRGRGRLPATEVDLDARQSGTTARFVLPVLATGEGRYRLDGDPQLRRRPMRELISAVASLGAAIDEPGEPGHLPVVVTGGPVGGGTVTVAGDISSQFLSGLLLAGPLCVEGIKVAPTTPVVGRPFLELTASVMTAFGGRVDGLDASSGGYRAATFVVEPDASAASYFFAAAAICGGRVTVEGLGADTTQGDLAFVDLLAAMGASIECEPDTITVRGTGDLRGIDADLRDIPDMALTLAAVAVFADGPTTVHGVGFVRGHESDRIAVVVDELEKIGVTADANPDGFTVHPGAPHGAVIDSHGDHRVAMAFALLGLRIEGIAITDPECVAKTFPAYFETLDSLQ